jgi:hypothetical protein
MASRQITTATAAPLPFTNFIYLEKLPATLKTYAATAPTRNRTYAMTAKTRAIPSLHRENFKAKEPGQVTGASLGNTTSPYCRAVIGYSHYQFDYQLNP